MKVTLEEMTEKFDDLEKDLKKPRPLLKAIGVLLTSSTKRRFEEGKEPSGKKWKELHPITKAARRGGVRPLLDSGTLKKSINYQLSGDNAVEIGTSLKYARTHQLGETITAKRAKMLAIPLRKESSARSPRDFKDLFVYKKSGRVYLAMRGGEKGKGRLNLFYLLKKSVKIPKRPFIGLSKEDDTDMMDLVHEFLARAI